ncbi:1-deoxy-D-xylulose-5-phosphate synthase [Sporotomaculum syntrophicum]|uniref:1-deoxy-D-xylulose-5-phosphate synthase n=1 Tax=Sporotomaculum syntrophicum TaxID=182264 RepID=A0A9D2WSF1_9FIRM|nr:1-deoxy-D-xylulose-5-phosphate synthase [Sporotomaculum syntrophicum]KAF1086524.1 1-deoxy-D-xylulose-5-phosphate synthase [Sporotomaculum syntrophicum]
MGRYLDQINSPRDVRALTLAQLDRLAGEIREEIIGTVAKNGGHLASNLGVVELTLALHCVFETPQDKIIWDVGHQCYVHKLVTGRREQFSSLRCYGGLSGFPRPDESEHDAFGTGHSSTSISVALGMVLARDFRGDRNNVVAVIGDGSMTGGMAFEALNHAGQLKKDLIVVLNDNKMSISANVGAMSGYLNRIRTDPKYSRGKDEIEHILRRIPTIGSTVAKVAERIKDSFKYLVVPGMIFEELGFTYLGPIDGHNIPSMLETLEQAKALGGPVLVHVVTEKGRGYAPAVQKADKFHGIGPFDINSGSSLEKNDISTYTEIFGRTLVKLAEQDPAIVAITAAMCSGTGLSGFAQKFPERFFDVGIAEQHAVTLAAGLASEGFKPVVAIYSTFLQRAYDQIIHDVCLPKLPVVFAVDRAGIVGDDGPTHHGLFDISYLRSVPNMSIMAPADENELQHMLHTALQLNSPCALRFPRGTGLGVALDRHSRALSVGQAEVLVEGKDITLLAVGNTVPAARRAASVLKEQGVLATVINARFIKPLDEECITRWAARTGRLITVEENILAGGFGASVLELLAVKDMTGVQVKCLGIGDIFLEHGSQSFLRDKYGLQSENIVNIARRMIDSGQTKGTKIISLGGGA